MNKAEICSTHDYDLLFVPRAMCMCVEPIHGCLCVCNLLDVHCCCMLSVWCVIVLSLMCRELLGERETELGVSDVRGWPWR